MDLERLRRQLPKPRDQVRKEQQVLHVMPVGHVEMPAFGERFDALHLGGKVAQVGGAKGRGALEHGALWLKRCSVKSVKALKCHPLQRFNGSLRKRLLKNASNEF